ncbi:MAG: hypothetical protein KBA79_00345 [Candidatus Cloacimonetes bacterium]|nr:hypothetical protein [Candidatus Cloacimonadota bacterium]
MIKELSQTLFWDVRTDTLDLQRHRNYIIPRVMDYGSIDEVRFVLSHYPEEVIKTALIQAPSLHKLTRNFFHMYYNIPLEEFNSWQRLQHAFWEER